jgi:hypothetical protein
MKKLWAIIMWVLFVFVIVELASLAWRMIHVHG